MVNGSCHVIGVNGGGRGHWGRPVGMFGSCIPLRQQRISDGPPLQLYRPTDQGQKSLFYRLWLGGKPRKYAS